MIAPGCASTPRNRQWLRRLRKRLANREHMRRVRKARKLCCVGVDLLVDAGTCERIVQLYLLYIVR